MLSTLIISPLAQVMILGTYHFADAGLDAVKTRLRPSLSTERQLEIADLVSRLAEFRPTRVAIEATPDRAETINKHLAEYVSGSYSLTPNEIDQIGFRLAKKTGIRGLTPIDSRLNLDFEGLMKFLGETDPTRAQHLGGLTQSFAAKFESWDARFSVGQILAIHNSLKYIAESHRFYVTLADATDGERFPGADMLGDWYKRNARIYGNLRRSIQQGDRVLVIYGSAHTKILRELIQDSGDLQLVEASMYLPPCPVPASEIQFAN